MMTQSPAIHHWWESLISHENSLRLAIAVVAFSAGAGYQNGHTTQKAITQISQQYGSTKAQVQVLKKQVDCEKFRADINGSLAISGGADPEVLAQCDRKGNLK